MEPISFTAEQRVGLGERDPFEGPMIAQRAAF